MHHGGAASGATPLVQFSVASRSMAQGTTWQIARTSSGKQVPGAQVLGLLRSKPTRTKLGNGQCMRLIASLT